MSKVREMNADLMLASSAREDTEQRKFSFASREPPLNFKLRLRRRAIAPHAILDRDATVFIFRERCVNDSAIIQNMAMHNREVFLLHAALFPKLPQLARGFIGLRHHRHAAGFAV